MAQARIRHPRTRDVKEARAGAGHSSNPGGRPTAYRAKYAHQAYGYTLLGATDKMLADFFEVSESTINLWKLKHPKFSESLKRGKAAADAQVAASLFKRATGFHVPAVKIMQHDGASYEHEFQEYHPPDTTAGIFWLKNRRPDLWRDKHQLETSTPDEKPVEEMSAEEIDRQLARLEQAKTQ